MRPVWGDRPLFFARAGMITLATLTFVVWVVAAPRVVSPGQPPPLGAPAGSAPKPLKIAIRSGRVAKPSISSSPILSKNASGSYSSGVAAAKTRVTGNKASSRAAPSPGTQKKKSAPKQPRGKPGPQASPGVPPAPTAPSTPTTTSPALLPAPPAEPGETTPVVPPGETPLVPAPGTVPTPGTPHHPWNGSSGYSRHDEQPRSQGNGCDKGPSAQARSDPSSRDRHTERRHS